MDEDQIYDDYLEQSRTYVFPACRYWRDGEVLGDNLDIFINLSFGDPEKVLGVTEGDEYWVARIQKDGVEQEKRFLVTEVEVPDGEELPYSKYPNDLPDENNNPMGQEEPLVLPDLPQTEESSMDGDSTVIPDIDDSGDVQVESGEDNIDIDYGSDVKSEGSIDDIPDDSIVLSLDDDGYSENGFYGEYISLEDLGMVVDEDGYITKF